MRFSIANTIWRLIVVIGMLGVPLACSGSSSTSRTPEPTVPPNGIKITIVTNDTKAEWLRLVTDAFNALKIRTAAGHQIVVVVAQESSPGPTVERIVKGELQPTLWSPGDISWVEQANQQLQAAGKQPVVTAECPRVVYAPTGFAMWRPMAEALGWPDKPIGWREIADLAGDPQGWAKYGRPQWGQFKFGHAHPEQSTTGFNMLATLAYAAASKTEGLTAADVNSPAVMDAFRKIEAMTYHYGTSTSSLLTLMARRGPTYLHAVTSSEAAVLKSNQVNSQTMTFPYVFIFPAEGAFWMDNPTCIVEASWVNAEKREAATIYRDYLLAPAQQDLAVQIGLRPAVKGVPLHTPIALESGTDPRVTPDAVKPLANVSGETGAAIINAFKETKKNATVILVLDSSVSMAGNPLRGAAAATNNFIARLGPADRIQVLVFNNEVAQIGPGGTAVEVRGALSQAVKQIQAGGQTALNDAVCMAVQAAEKARDQDRAVGERRLYGVVVLSDGEDNRSKQKDVFACLKEKGEDVEGVKVFTIAYGAGAPASQLKKMAEATNGKTFAADEKSIEQVYLTVSAEQ